jgi:hypothetical protein
MLRILWRLTHGYRLRPRRRNRQGEVRHGRGLYGEHPDRRGDTSVGARNFQFALKLHF